MCRSRSEMLEHVEIEGKRGHLYVDHRSAEQRTTCTPPSPHLKTQLARVFLACVEHQTANGVASISQTLITASVCYIGDRTKESSQIVLWDPGDPGDPYKLASNIQTAYYRSTCGRTHACYLCVKP